jgi:plastocyanin
MKLGIIIVIVIVILSGGVWLMRNQQSPTDVGDTTSDAAEPAAVTIEMKDKDYEPSNVTIKVGQTVAFMNSSQEDRWPASNIHPTHEIYSEFDPKQPVRPGEIWTFTFDKAGIWKFHDHLFPTQTGTITVEE